MPKSTKILYEHLKDYPASTEGYREIKAPAVAAALYCEQMAVPSDERAADPHPTDRRFDPIETA